MHNKRRNIFIITFIVILLIIIGLFFYFQNNKKQNKPNEQSNSQSFNPFGTSDNVNSNQNNNNNNSVDWTNNTSAENSRFNQISKLAIAGAGYFEETKQDNSGNNQTIPYLRYVDRVTGHIYEDNLKTNKETKISNSTIPGVHEVLINSSAKTFIYRYLSSVNNSITSYVATLGESKGEFLPSNIIDISTSPDKNNYFYLVKTANGVSGFIDSFDKNNASQVFTFPFSDWRSQWINSQTIYLTTKPSSVVDGALFSLNAKNGTLTKLFGGVKGLTTLSNSDGSLVVYGASLATGPKLELLNTKDHTTKTLDSYGLPEKCIWAQDNINIYCAIPNKIIGNNYPDSWYQGLVSFDDYFVKINTKTGDKSTLANSTNQTPVDAINLFLDKNGDTLFFTNKKDSTLWSLKLN